MSQALYRTYRSRSLAEIVGQEHITNTLARALKAGRISHAYLFTGPRGTGKTSVARILAHEINGLPYSEAQNLDIIEIDAASNRRIDDIRDLREKVHIAPVNAKYKVYIIDEVHMLTGESFNALLKTLEEPPSHVVFILATTEVHKLPATIISRVQRYSFRPGTQDKVIAHLKMIAQKEKISIEDAAVALIAEQSEGSFRDSLSLLDQLTHICSGTITAQAVADTLGIPPKEHIASLVAATISGDIPSIMQILAALKQQGSNPAAITDQLSAALLLHAPQHPHVLHVIDNLLEVPRAYNPRLKLITALAATAVAAPAPAQHKPKTIAAPITPEPVTLTAPQQAAEPQASKPKPQQSKPQPITTNNQPATLIAGDNLQQLSTADWSRVLAAAREKSPPIFAVLKQAKPVIADGNLVLQFKYALHSKKLDDVKQKAFIAEILQTVLGKNAPIKVAVNKDIPPPPIITDPAITAVTKIMGGGVPI